MHARIPALAIVFMCSGANPSMAEDLIDAEAAAKALLRPVCASADARAAAVKKIISEGGEYEEYSAQWDMDVTCEQLDLPTAPVHDTADLADEASHRDWIYDARWSPDGASIVTAGRDKTVRIWDFATGKSILRIDIAALPASKPGDDHGMVRHALFLAGGNEIVVAADGHPVRILDASTGKPVGEIPYEQPAPDWEMPPFIDASASGLVILGGYGGDIVAYDVKAKAERYRLPGYEREYPRYAISDAGKLLALVLPGTGGHARVQVFELETGKPVWSLDAPTGREYDNSANGIALSRDGRQLAVDVRGSTLIYDAATKKLVARIPAHPYFGHRNSVFTADGKGLVSGLNYAMLSDIASAKRLRHFGPYSDGFHSASLSPDGKYLVTGHFGSDGRIWEIETGKFFRRLGKDVKPPR